MKWISSLLIFFMQTSHISSQIQFSDFATQAGINHEFNYGAPGGGVSFIDFDQDGKDDITLATEEGKEIFFYKNFGSTFLKLPTFVDHLDEGKQVLWVDFDNDNDLDLYVTSYRAPNRLYQNQGDLDLVDITASAGLPIDSLFHYGASWADYNRDGWLDLYFTERKTLISGTVNRNRLFKNNADGTFSETTNIAQVEDAEKLPFCAAFFDFNNDKWPDIYIANDKLHPNTLLKNNGNGTFLDISAATQSNVIVSAMCVAVGDYNNDALQDLYITNLPPGSVLLKNIELAGLHFFSEESESAGVGFYGTGWGSNFLDANNNGLLDLYVSGADVGSSSPSSTFYKNEGDGTFSSDFMGFAGDTVRSYSNAIGDFNEDGFPDIMVSNFSPFLSQLWKNNGGNNNWLKVNLEGVLSNRQAIGSKIEVYIDTLYQMRYTHCGIGYLGQNSDTEIIGMGNAAIADSIIITWPTGHQDKLFNIDAYQTLDIVEGSTTNGNIMVDSDVTLTEAPTVSVNEALSTDRFAMTISPNPAQDFINISINNQKNETGELLLYDMLGNLTHQWESTKSPLANIQVKLTGVTSGLYFLTYRTKSNSFSQKIVIHK